MQLRARLPALLIAVSALSTSASPALAYRGASRSTHVFPARYAACHEEREVRTEPPPPAPGNREILVAVPTLSSAPSSLRLLDDIADDVSFTEPVPAVRDASPPRPPVQTVVVMGEARNAFPCLGALRGKAGILRVLGAPPGARFYGRTDATDWRADNIVAAAMFNLTTAIPPLRATLTRPVSDPRSFDKVSLRTEAAIGLAALGDVQSAAGMTSWLVELEEISWANMWSDTFESLLQVSPDAAERYAIELLRRAADGALGDDIASDRIQVLEALTVRTRDESLPILARLTSDPANVPFGGSGHAYCLMLAARVRLGESRMVAEAREQMAGELTSSWAANCFSEVRDALPWDEPSDVDALVHRRAYEAMLRWLEPPASPSNARARARLRDWLQREVSSAAVGQPDHVHYHRDTRAMHLGALAALGDDKARALLYEMVLDAHDDTDAPWIAAYLAVHFGLPEAVDRARQRLLLGLSQTTSRRWYEATVGPELNWRTRLMDELLRQAPSDPSWTLGLLDESAPTREWTLSKLSRIRTQAACQVIADAAPDAKAESVTDAFWALTTLGDACRSAIEPLARNPRVAPKVRGPAIEYLAMIRHPDAMAIAREAQGDQALRPAAQRAMIIARSRE